MITSSKLNINQEHLYIAIAKTHRGYYSFFVGNIQSLKSFKNTTNRWGLEIVAEQIDLTEKEVDNILGYKLVPSDDGLFREDNAVKIGTEYLKDLTEKLNQGANLNPQAELQKLVDRLNQNP